jgi:hypothetical protein
VVVPQCHGVQVVDCVCVSSVTSQQSDKNELRSEKLNEIEQEVKEIEQNEKKKVEE